jgi:hypothetical protein
VFARRLLDVHPILWSAKMKRPNLMHVSQAAISSSPYS